MYYTVAGRLRASVVCDQDLSSFVQLIVIVWCGVGDLPTIFLLTPIYVNQGHKRSESPC